MASERKGAREGDDFAWTRLEPAERALYEHTFSIFLVQVKSDSDIGKQLLTDPLAVFRENIPEMGIADDSDVRAMLLRVNAEIPANPVHRSEVWMVYPGTTTAVGVQYKYTEAQEAEAQS
jgi:hypothetical protein